MISLMQVAGQLESPTVQLAAHQCLRRRHKEAPCHQCIEACPTQAISDINTVSLNTELCVRCGLCLHRCPTEAFSKTGNQADTLLKVFESTESGSIELTCPHKERLEMSRSDVSTAIVIKPCLANISLATLLKAAINREIQKNSREKIQIWLNDEPCGDCSIGHVQTEICKTVDFANKWLAIFGKETRILTYQNSPEHLRKREKKTPVLQGDRIRYSRRGFLRSLTNPTPEKTEAMPEAIQGADTNTNPRNDLQNVQRLNTSRDLLIESINKLGKPVAATANMQGMPFGNVHIEAGCVACGLCARFCPSDALTFEFDEDTFQIQFNASYCLGCNICSFICPPKIVEMSPVVEITPLLTGTTTILTEGLLVRCQMCGMSCAGEQDEPLCFVCQWRNMI